MQKLGACLLDAREDDDGPSTANMNKWAAEATSLMVCMALRNPWAVRAFNAAVDASSSPGKICAGQWKSSHLLVCSCMTSMMSHHCYDMCLCRMLTVCVRPPNMRHFVYLLVTHVILSMLCIKLHNFVAGSANNVSACVFLSVHGAVLLS